ncbi:ABC transporter permease [Vibrio sp. 10N.261.55.A7]|uniref:ABC transporter permease n=1 Tax=Vibrio sp. 10N.261.55.A7 TaxID=1880851 RepID=UPI000C837AC2|nr:ABC transporter permease [Vibrio sp. 10N.261.55.A7]PMK03608.1 multidrug ABC transporter permease [Vibrio sp. 10N.261.55.A7]
MKHLQQQYQIIKNDRWLVACITWIPIALALCIWGIFSSGIARDLPIGVVDLSRSSLSYQLTHQLDASPTLSVETVYSDVMQAKQALIESDIYAYMVIPKNFDKTIYKQAKPKVSTFYNTQAILVGRLISSAVTQSMGYFNASIETGKQLTSGDTTIRSAMAKAVPIQTQITALFNKNTHYGQFLVTAIVPALWQVVMVASTILILATNLRHHRTLDRWLAHSPTMQLIHTLKGAAIIFSIQGALFLAWFYVWLDWPFHGSIFAIIIAQWATVLSCIIMGCLFFFLTLDATRAMSFAGAFTAPSFAFMGITFPVTDMNIIAQGWRSLLPISHYIEVQVSQANYALTTLESVKHLLPMLGYFVVAVGCIALIKVRLKQSTLVSTPAMGNAESQSKEIKDASLSSASKERAL